MISVSLRDFTLSVISSVSVITVSAVKTSVVKRFFSLSLYNLFMNFLMNSVFFFQSSSYTLSITVTTLFSLSINIIIYDSVRSFRVNSENDLVSETVI
ncbi:hypothetical protein EMPG_13712 [Blastomyces silverae]|uniref:Uncharacterized protein n=1 Tax=Blastomyces silverae TaxID=2060906 RepID=A0A0H1BI37_9EURO|nr:hypothetical protein EMPG_13712 [Blastomyces silverae]